MSFELAALPYDKSALEPYISRRTIEFHFEKHHKGYLKKLNNMTADTDYDRGDLEQLIRDTADRDDKKGLFNNAAQVWNHTLYWFSMTPDGGGAPDGKVAELINKSFGDYDTFRTEFREAGLGEFGSGWVWLVRDGDTLRIESTTDAEVPTLDLDNLLLTMDVWEHAYYLDRQNERAAYVDGFLDNLLSWDAVEGRLDAALSRAQPVLEAEGT